MLVIALGNTQHFTIKSFKCCIYRVLLFVLKIYLKTFSFTNLFLLIISLNVSSIQGVYQTRRHFPFIFPTSLYAQHIWKTEKRLMVMMIILLFIISNTFGKSNIHHHHGHHYHLLIYQPPHHYIIIIVTITTIIIVTIIIVVMKISSRYNESDSRQATNHHRSQFLPTLLSHVFGVYHQHHNRPK